MRAHAKSGFAMPLVLVMTAILTLTFAVCIVALRGLSEQTRLAKAGAEFEQAALTAEARLVYLMATEPFSATSLDIGSSRRIGNAAQQQTPPLARLFLDARPYVWRDDPALADAPAYLAQVQDEAGLVNLYQMDVLQLQRLFEWAGMEPRDAENLANEIVAYNAQPQLHQPMRRPIEIFRFEIAKEKLTDKMWRALAQRVTTYPDNRAVNINTAPAEVLQIWFDLSEQQALDVVRNRDDDVVLTSTADIGVVVGANQNYAFSGGRLRLQFTDPATGLSYQSSLVFTPNSATRPVWVENPQTVRLADPPQLPEEPEDFPTIQDFAA